MAWSVIIGTLPVREVIVEIRRILNGTELPESRFSMLIADLYELTSGSPMKILLIRAHGRYQDGSAGKPDAAYLSALQTAAICRRPNGIVLDFSDLIYEWGDDIEEVLPGDDGRMGEPNLFGAVVVGPGCGEALRTLSYGINSKEPLESLSWIYPSVPDAVSGIAERIATA